MDDNNNKTSCLPCTPEEEKRIVNELTKVAENNLKEGNLYYVLSNKWYTVWERYCGQGTGNHLFDENVTISQHSNGFHLKASSRPGQIDNSHLVVEGSGADGNDLEIQRTMEEGRDYVLVPQEVWKKLYDWYKGGPALSRKLISQGVCYKTFSVEVFPLSLNLTDSRNNRKFVLRISKKASVRELYNRVCSLLELDPEKVHIWDYFNRRKHARLTVSNKTLEEVSLQMDQDILLEMQIDGYQPSRFGMDSTGNELALVSMEPSSSSVTISNGYSTGYGSYMMNGNSSSSLLADAEDEYDLPSATMTKGEGGLAGLQNLGNTCFMNSAIQCLVHTPPLVEYFLQDYSAEINEQNPLGLQGELAIAFGELLRKLWSSGTSIAPRAFKAKLARFAPQFSGYNQHDSQELLAFLLDGLHEDLNRVKNKPYIEAKDANGRPDEEVANECWDNHKARNDSVIVDVCQGQYKSTLVCPICSKISVTFDPFMYLSLPLPSKITRSMTITVFYGNGSALPMPFIVTVSKNDCVKDLDQALSNECCLETGERLLLAEVYGHKIYRYFENPSEPLSNIKGEDHIVAYRVPKMQTGLTRLVVLHRSKERSISGDSKLVGTPLVTCIAKDPLTGADIQPLVHMMLAPLLKTPSSLPLNQVLDVKKNVSGIDTYTPISSCNIQSLSTDKSNGFLELEQVSNGDSSFKLSLTEDKGLSCKAIDSDTVFRQGQTVSVLLDWSDRERELYDISYLENLPEVYKAATGVFGARKTRQEPISLFSCLDAFLKEEPLGEDDMWYCPTCEEHRQAAKKLDLWRLPEILVFHLKRFSYNRYLKDKLETFVNFPIHNLDLSNYTKIEGDPPQSHLYELYAISNHYGSLGGGHYTAYAKLDEGNRWYHFDDSFVSSVGEDELKTAAAYLLFYRRVQVQQEKSQVVGEPSLP